MKNKLTYEELLQKYQQLESKILEQNSNSTSQLFELSLDMLCITDIDGSYKLVNSAFKKTLGYSDKELIKHPYLYYIHPDDLKSTQMAMDKISTGQPIINFQNRYRCIDGSYKCLHWTFMPVISENLTYAVARDVTEQKLLIEKLQKSHSYLESIYRAAPTGIGLVKERILIDVNELVCQITGYAREELINQNTRLLYPNDEEYNFVGQEKYQQIQDKGTGTVETQWQCRDGHIIDVLLSSTPLNINDISQGVTFTVLDISKRKNIERNLQASQEKYLDLYEHAPDMYLSIDAQSAMILECNQTTVNILGYNKGEIIGHPVFNLYAAESVEYVRKQVFPLFQKLGVIHNEQLKIKKKDGSKLDVSLNASAIRDAQGTIIRSRSVLRDISKTIQLETQLTNTLQHYQGFFEQAPQPYQSLDKEGCLIEVNAAWRKTLGYDVDDLKNKCFGDLLAPGFKKYFDEIFPQLKLSGEIHGVEFIMRHRDGTLIDVIFDGRIVKNEQGIFQQAHCLLTDITEQKRINSQLTLFRQQIEQSKDAFYVIDYTSSQILDVNESASNMLGYSRDELLEKSIVEISSIINSLKKWQEIATLVKNQKQGQTIEDEFIQKYGPIIPVEVSTIYQVSNGREVFVSSIRDISERKIKEQLLKDKNKFIQTVIDGVNDSIMVINTDYSISMMNRSARNSINETYINNIKSPKCYEVSHHQNTPCSGKDHPCPLTQVLQHTETSTLVHQHKTSVDDTQYMELTASPLKDSNGTIYAIIESSHDITSLIKTQKELHERSIAFEHQANHDVLTNLPNRLLFIDRLSQAIKLAQRRHNKIAILFIDLDRFKEINDSLGHIAGDEILKEVSLRLQSCIRKADTVARLGGDEFLVLLDDVKDSNFIIEIALQILEKIAATFIYNEQQLYVTSSIGISLYPNDGQTSETLIRNADSALYKAKEEGRNTYRYYTQDMTEKAFEHILLESNLRHALDNHELVVYYQPQVNGKNHQIKGMEALVRWQHPRLGLISPTKFIPLAEKTGLIIQLGEQVLQIATKQMAKWKKNDHSDFRLAINLSVKQLLHEGFIGRIRHILKENQCQAQWIELEVTEGYLITNPEQAINTLQQLKKMGFTISVDDFGTGYSSLSYLKRLPINKLKIDQSFIMDLSKNEDDRAIVIAIISLAKAMRLNVIAEGVETLQQKLFLLDHGCNSIQGYYYSRPVPENEMTKLLKTKKID